MRWRKTTIAALAAALLAAVSACAPSGAGPVDGPPTKRDAAGASDADGAPATGTPVRILDWDAVESLVKESAGKVVVLDVWSTYCSPCMRELPRLVALRESLGDAVRCLTVSVDYIGAANRPPESYRDNVQRFLDRIQARLVNILCSTPDDIVFEKLGIASIPCVVVYDRSGKIRKTFHNDASEYGEDGFTYARHVEPLVRDLVAEP
ncbi:MAG: TlpA family protein disulfide reductase [Planctomycetes bacterium]|nr:TlpA family protein disulfide reductase [Planctomycetota bacterium]